MPIANGYHYMKSLGDNLKTARERTNLNQKSAAHELEMSQGKLSKMEADKVVPNIDELLIICSVYKTSINRLFRDTEYEKLIDSTDRGLYNIDSDVMYKFLSELEQRQDKVIKVYRENQQAYNDIIRKLLMMLKIELDTFK